MEDSSDLDSKKTKRRKVDPSFKSKRYRDKLRAEVKALENLIPVDRPTLNKKLDSQTIYRLAIAYLRVKAYFEARKLKFDTCNRLTPSLRHNISISAETYPEHREDDGNFEDAKNGPTSTESNHNSGEPFAGSDMPRVVASNCNSFLEPSTLYQIIDGFVMLVSADGTIVYVTENVSKYTGFNQTDLMHRCLYSVVHPQDHGGVRDNLEQYHLARNIVTPKHDGVQQELQEDTFQSSCLTIESFFCRIRCYHGNTSGFIKLHCSGKWHHLSEMPKTLQTTNSVVLLYCQPFLKTGSDVMTDWNEDVFWSKHDLDLRFKEIEETGVLGYCASDVCEKSLYQFVHPEDLPILVNVHKAVTRVTEVQTFFFRLQTRSGGWLWIYCKGKVVCKNSKKFSIVFSHSPIRDEDNVFVKQEAVLRRQRLGHFLQNSLDTNLYGENPNQQQHDHLLQGENFTFYGKDSLSSCYKPDQRALLSSLDMLNMACPSSWHADKDRHSPVLPQSHAVQKILNRERQLCIAEYRKKQYAKQNEPSISPGIGMHRHHVTSNTGSHQTSVGNTPYRTTKPYPCSHWNNVSNTNAFSTNMALPYNNCANYNGTSYSYPHLQQFSHPYHQGLNNHYITSFPTSSQCNKFSRNEHFHGNIEQNYNFTGNEKHVTYNNPGLNVPNYDLHERKIFASESGLHNFYSSANFRLSMVCNADISISNQSLQEQENVELRDFGPNNWDKEKIHCRAIKNEQGAEYCCGVSEKVVPTERQSVKYDIEASVYMRIVEAQGSQSSNTSLEPQYY